MDVVKLCEFIGVSDVIMAMKMFFFYGFLYKMYMSRCYIYVQTHMPL